MYRAFIQVHVKLMIMLQRKITNSFIRSEFKWLPATEMLPRLNECEISGIRLNTEKVPSKNP